MFQAKQDYGFDLADQLAEKAVGELEYEIDTEIVNLLDETAGEVLPELTFSKTLPIGVNKRDHYEAFNEIIQLARKAIYDRTKRYAPTYMVCASDLLPVLSFIPAFKAAAANKINGPYLAGTIDGLKVYVSPAMAQGRYIFGVNDGEMNASVAVWAPYMAIVPTQLLGFADGAMSQGWSTLYALELLNKDLVVAGALVA